MRNIVVSVLFLLPGFAVAQTPRIDFVTGRSDPIADSYFQFAGISPVGATWNFSHHSIWEGEALVVGLVPATRKVITSNEWTRPLTSSRAGASTSMTGWAGPGTATAGYLPTPGMAVNLPDGTAVIWLTVRSLGPVNNNLNASNGGKSAGIVGAYSK